MRIAEKLFSCLSLFLLCLVCLLTDVPKVWAAEFLTADDGTFLYMRTECNFSLLMTALCS